MMCGIYLMLIANRINTWDKTAILWFGDKLKWMYENGENKRDYNAENPAANCNNSNVVFNNPIQTRKANSGLYHFF